MTPESWIGSLCRRDSATIRILSVKVSDSGRFVTHFVEISSNKSSAEDLTKELRKSSDVIDSDIASVGANRIVGAVTSNDCVVCSIITESKTGYFLGPATTELDCQMSYKLFMSGEGIPGFLQTLHDKGVLYKISEIAKMTTSKALTTKQEHVLKTALELGYYDYPKRISTEDLSKTVGLATSTVSEILRRAERRIITGYFETSHE
ncbi:MAG: helix-turn-helix domain-containing protein [Thaumarchaeota archaeon]|nr:helix-turn-helix domain-containing protein [Nitrososphaerota archaeon]